MGRTVTAELNAETVSKALPQESRRVVQTAETVRTVAVPGEETMTGITLVNPCAGVNTSYLAPRIVIVRAGMQSLDDLRLIALRPLPLFGGACGV